MFSKILLKLIDQAIVPAMLLIGIRLVSVVFFSRYLGIPFTFGPTGFSFSNPTDFVAINSYSLFAMIFVLIVGLLYILIKAYSFHDSHIKPSTTAKLFVWKIPFFIQSSFELYSQGAVWLSYAFLLMFTAAIMGVFRIIFPWVFVASLILCLIATVLFVLDVEREIVFDRKKDAEDAQDTVINLHI